MKHGSLLVAVSACLLMSASARAEETFRVMTYNLHLGDYIRKEHKAPDTLKPFLSIANRLKHDVRVKNPDILGVQELCAMEEGGYQVDYLQKAVADGKSYFFWGFSDPSIKLPCGRVEAIFSRWPIRAAGLIQLPDLKEPRSAIWADIEIPTADGGSRWLRVYDAHMENRPNGDNWEGRFRQARAILDHLEPFRRDYPDRPVILLGDLNTVGLIPAPWVKEWALREIGRYLTPTLDHYTPTLVPAPYQLDWIFYNGLELLESHVARFINSDHYPVVADFGWKN